MSKESHTIGLSTRVNTIDTAGGRILCIADLRGKLSQINQLAAEHNAKAVIHTGDFGFYEAASLPRVNDRTLKHIIQYSNAISPQFRAQLTSPNLTIAQVRQMLANPQSSVSNGAPAPGSSNTPSSFALSEFPKLLTGELKFNVPVYTVWGACEDVAVLEKLRVATPGPISINSTHQQQTTDGQVNWSIPNLAVLSESSTRTLVIGGVRLRLFGLGGAYVPHKMFDNGEGQATIAGGSGTMWTTMLQIGELVDTAARVYDPTETRLLVTHASPGREGLISQLALALKADLTISASLHFRYGVSYNEFSVQHDQEAFRNKFAFAKAQFDEVWHTVQSQVESVIDQAQRRYLDNALAVTSRVPEQGSEELAWKNTWNWNLPDAAFGSLVLDIKDGRVSSEMKSQGFNYTYRATAGKGQQSQAAHPSASSKQPPSRPPSVPKHQNQTSFSQGAAAQKQPAPAPNALPPKPQESSPAPVAKPEQTTSGPSSMPDRPASQASSRRSSNYQGKRGAAQAQGTHADDKAPAGATETKSAESGSAPDATPAADSDAKPEDSDRGGWRGRGRGNRGRSAFSDRGGKRGSVDGGSRRGGRGGKSTSGEPSQPQTAPTSDKPATTAPAPPTSNGTAA